MAFMRQNEVAGRKGKKQQPWAQCPSFVLLLGLCSVKVSTWSYSFPLPLVGHVSQDPSYSPFCPLTLPSWSQPWYRVLVALSKLLGRSCCLRRSRSCRRPPVSCGAGTPSAVVSRNSQVRGTCRLHRDLRTRSLILVRAL